MSRNGPYLTAQHPLSWLIGPGEGHGRLTSLVAGGIGLCLVGLVLDLLLEMLLLLLEHDQGGAKLDDGLMCLLGLGAVGAG